VAEALAFLHAQGVVHRDVKRPNVRFDGRVGTLLDFNCAARWREGDPPLRGRVGTEGWWAPEAALGEAHTSKVDSWGLGSLLMDALLVVTDSDDWRGAAQPF